MAIRVESLSSHTGVCALLLIALLAPADVASQEPIVPLELSYSDPGARSMGFGGAFVALADDATAAYANPAGLVQLARPEVSIEGRRWSYSTPFTQSGRVEGPPSGFGIDTVNGLRTDTSNEVVTGLSFLSVAYPKGKWSLAAYRHQLANFEYFSETQGLFGGGSNCCQIRQWDQQVTTDMEVVSYGISAAYRINDKLDIGFGAVYYDVFLLSQATMFLPDVLPEGFFGPTSFFPERSLLSEDNVADDTDWGLTAGFVWRLPKGWKIGGVYRQGPEVELAAERKAGEASDLGVPPGGVLFRVSGVPLELPDVTGLGFAYRAPNGGLTVTFQWDYIEYSSITESLGLDDQTVDNAQELHLGGEYVFLRSKPIVAVRLGAWLDPDHQIRATTDDPFVQALLPRGDDEMHYTAGLGVALQSFQIDLGVDIADRVDTASVSVVYSF
jgi:long-subunit fatty acid transport protein